MRSAPLRAPAHREDIKAAIRKRGLTLRSVCTLVDGAPVGPSIVTDVLAGQRTSARVEVALAVASGYSLAEVQQVTRGANDRDNARDRDHDNDRDSGSAFTDSGGRSAANDRDSGGGDGRDSGRDTESPSGRSEAECGTGGRDTDD